MTSRHRAILQRLDQQGACSYQELTDALGVSTMTVRRDVDELAKRGLLIKALGGPQRANAAPSLYETALKSRLSVRRLEKREIAEAALSLVADNATVFLDGGTTCLELAKLLATRREAITIVTNSALACLELGRTTANMIVSLGGQFDVTSASFVGPSAEDQATRYFVDVALVSTKGLVASEGTYESSVATFRIKQIVAAQCAKLALLADHSKFGQRALSKVLDIEQIHTVVTDAAVPEKDLATLRNAGREVLIASPENAAR